MRVMVNGATGLVGRSLVEAFLDANHEVRASDRPGSDFSDLEKMEVEIVPAELDDSEALGKAVKGMDCVANVAGLFDLAASADLLEKINHQGVRNMCEAVLKHAPDLQRFVQIATVGVYGKPVRCPCGEDFPKRPRNHYEKTKFKGELAAFEYHKKHGLPVASIRPTLVYGPRARYGHAMFIAALSLMKERRRPLLYSLRSGPLTSHVHVEDVGRAAVLVATDERAIGRAFNVADPNPVNGPEFVHALADPLGIEVKPIIPYSGLLMDAVGFMLPLLPSLPFNKLNGFLTGKWNELCDEKGLTRDLRLRLDREWVGYMTGDNFYDVSALKSLGMEWKWPHLKQGLEETVKWYRERKWIP